MEYLPEYLTQNCVKSNQIKSLSIDPAHCPLERRLQSRTRHFMGVVRILSCAKILSVLKPRDDLRQIT